MGRRQQALTLELHHGLSQPFGGFGQGDPLFGQGTVDQLCMQCGSLRGHAGLWREMAMTPRPKLPLHGLMVRRGDHTALVHPLEQTGQG